MIEEKTADENWYIPRICRNCRILCCTYQQFYGVSIGVLWEEEKKNIIGMIKQADNIMYEAKRKYHLMQNETVE